MRAELAAVARQYATEQRYTFLGSVDVRFAEDPDLSTGMFRIRSQAHADAPEPPAVPSRSRSARVTGHPRLVIGSASYPLTRSHTRLGRGQGPTSRSMTLRRQPGTRRDRARTTGRRAGPGIDERDAGRRTSGVDEAPLYDGARIQVGSTVITYRDV